MDSRGAAGDDIYRLARLYNERFLPLKERAQAREQWRRVTDLKLSDVKEVLRR
jgi:hypothetical protein